jgi:hypothetical protein
MTEEASVFRRHRKKTIAIFIVAMILALASAAEFTLRWTGYLPATAYYQTTDELTVEDMFRTDQRGIFKANPAFWANVPGVSINSDGFRSPEFSTPAQGKKTVLVIGDSHAYGIGAEPFSNAFPDLIRNAGYAVHNTGVPGTGPSQYRLVADHYLARLKPDVTLVAFFVGNDLQVKLDPAVPDHNLIHVTNAGWILGFDECDRPLTAQEAYDYYIGRTPPPGGNFLLATSLGTAMWNLVARPANQEKVKAARPPCAPAAPPSGFGPTFEVLRHIRDLAAANKSTFLLLVIPARGQGCSAALRDISRHREAFDALNPIYLEDIPEATYIDAPSCHIRNAGHRFIADRILPRLE